MENYCTPDGARKLAAKIVAYWRERGETVDAKAEPGPINSVHPTWTVRSDMRNGMPRHRPAPQPVEVV